MTGIVTVIVSDVVVSNIYNPCRPCQLLMVPVEYLLMVTMTVTVMMMLVQQEHPVVVSNRSQQ